MTPSPGATVRLARLLHELKTDLSALDARASELSGLSSTESQEPSARTTSIVAAVNIHAWYTALETAFERVARLLDENMPAGSAWHSDLIAQMSVDIPGIRPALIEPGVQLELEEIRKFRHFFRNAYVLEFDPARVRELSAQVTRVHPVLRARFQELCSHIDAVLEALAGH